MAGVYQTEFQMPTASCAAFLDHLVRDGFRFTQPFELQATECLARISTPEMAADEFWLSFSESSSASTSRRVDLHWHRLRGSDGHPIARLIASRVQAVALQHEATICWGAVAA